MNEIRIVKFINPNYFFYYNKIDGDKLSEINKTEEKLKKTLQHNQEYVQKPEIGKVKILNCNKYHMFKALESFL
jgi:hypothetical protein